MVKYHKRYFICIIITPLLFNSKYLDGPNYPTVRNKNLSSIKQHPLHPLFTCFYHNLLFLDEYDKIINYVVIQSLGSYDRIIDVRV